MNRDDVMPKGVPQMLAKVLEAADRIDDQLAQNPNATHIAIKADAYRQFGTVYRLLVKFITENTLIYRGLQDDNQ